MGRKVKDIQGQKFGKWEVISRAPNGEDHARWYCRCICGTEKDIKGCDLRTGASKQCTKCQFKEKEKDRTGQIIRGIEVIRKIEGLKNNDYKWLCKCFCGKEFITAVYSIEYGKTTSCGCNAVLASRKNITEYNKIRPREKGPKHFKWDHSISLEQRAIKRTSYPGYKEWCYFVHKKYNFTCQKCNVYSKNIKLHAHHIKSWKHYKDLRINLNNGITFCNKCHMQFHKIYGRKENNLNQVKEFINDSSFDPSSG
jgi:hypothetical protein